MAPTYSRLKWGSIFVAVLIALGVGYSCVGSNNGRVIEFQCDRDLPEVRQMLKKDLYWLTTEESYNHDFLFQYRCPNQNPLYFGKLEVKVIRNNVELVGFITYYMKQHGIGQIQFLAVKDAYRGKRYGQILLKHALNDLAHKGARTIELITRPSNLSGQRLYNRVGFVEQGRDETFVYFQYTVH